MEDELDGALNEVLVELNQTPEPPAGELTEPVTEPTEVDSDAESNTGDTPEVEEAAPAEPEIQPSIPYDRFKEVNEARIRAEEQARIYQEQLQRMNVVEPEPEPEEDYSITAEEWEYMDDASKKVYLQNQLLQDKLDKLEQAVGNITPVIQQSQAQAQAQEELKTAIADITDIAGPMSDTETQLFNAKLEEIAKDAIANQKQVTIAQVARMAYRAMKSTPVVPPKPVVNPVAQKAKEAVAPPGGGVSVPSGAKPIVEGTMSFNDAIQMALNEIPKPHK